MSRIQIADLNSSEFGFLYDVNDTEMLAIVGGNLFKRIVNSVKNEIKFQVKPVVDAIKRIMPRFLPHR